MHQVYLSLGSNIQPETNLPKAIDLLHRHGKIPKISSAWEFKAMGTDGPNFLNACVLFSTPLLYDELKDQVTRPIEAKLGRQRGVDKFAPRTMDIDIIIFNNESCDDKFWKQAFVVVPLAEIYPIFQNPLTQETIAKTATRLQQQTWMKPRSEVLSQFNGAHFES